MNWTDAQKKAIDLREKSILVSAAAGSGKTAVLVERIKQLIDIEKIRIDELLIVTFTNAAASEMREKIVSAIPEQMNQIHRSHISTFHSFALEVIRRYFHLLDIEPGFKICDDAQRILLQNQAMDRLFHESFEKNDREFLQFLRLYGSSRNEEGVKSMIIDIYNFIQSLPEPYNWLDEKIELLSINEEDLKNSHLYIELTGNINEALEMAISDCEKVLGILEDKCIESLVRKAKEDIETVRGIAVGFSDNFEVGRKLINSASFERFVVSKTEKGIYEDVREDIKYLRDRAKETLKKIAGRYCVKSLADYIVDMNKTYESALHLKELVLEFNKLYTEIKKKKNLVDFYDIEQYALKILSDDNASTEYKNKFRYIFIDEYQDSNLVQEAIIDKIQRGDNVFMVGDVKQSIYKFRLAEPEIFIRKYEKFKAGLDPLAVKLDLNKNFRSKEPIIKAVNHLFGNIMNSRNSGIEYDDAAALYKGVNYKGPLDHAVELHLVDDKIIEDSEIDDEIKAMKKAELEALTAVKLIKNAKGMPYFDEKNKEEKRLQNKDIVILLRSTSGMAEIYYEALAEEGIPAYMDAGDGYFDTTEISIIINLLQIIDNKKQDVALLSALRSPIFGFSINELAEIRNICKGEPYYKALLHYSLMGDNVAIREKCNQVFSTLDSWRQKSGFLPLPDFIWKLINDTGYYNYAGALPGGAQRQANLRALADKASLYENNSGVGLFGFIRYIEAVKSKKIASAPIKLIGESDDVVRIMTVHKSKGLEYPMVLLGGLGKLFHREAGKRFVLHKELGLGIRQVDENLCCYRDTLIQKLIEDRVYREAIAEEIRILYVALTRGMDKLIMLGTLSDIEKQLDKALVNSGGPYVKGRSFLDFILPGLIDCRDVGMFRHRRDEIGFAREKIQNKRINVRRELNEATPAKSIGSDESAYAKTIENVVNRRLDWTYPFPGALHSKSKYSVTELSRDVEKPKRRRAIGSEHVQTGAKRGTIYHAIMERIPLEAEGWSIQQLEIFARKLVDMELISKDELEIVDLSKIADFFQSTLGQRLLKAEKVYREEAFNLLKTRDGEEIIVQGIIDCYFIEGDKCVLIDFKSDYVADNRESIDALAEVYRPQLSLYKEALEKIRGIAVDEIYLYLFHIGREIRLES